MECYPRSPSVGRTVLHSALVSGIPLHSAPETQQSVRTPSDLSLILLSIYISGVWHAEYSTETTEKPPGCKYFRALTADASVC